jgi:predicted PurR-regulated permease PerM
VLEKRPAVSEARAGWRPPPWLDRAAGFSWRLLVVLVLAGVLIGLLIALQVVLLPLVFALLLTTVLSWPAQALRTRGLSPGMAALATLLILLAGLAAGAWLLASQVWANAEELRTQIDAGATHIQHWLEDGSVGASTGQAADAKDTATDTVHELAGPLISGLVTVVPVVAALASQLILTLIITFFYLRDGRRLWVWIVRQVPSVNVPLLERIGDRSWDIVRGYVRGQAVIATFDAVAIGLGVWLIGLPLVLPIAVLTFFLAFIPQVGAVVSGGIAVLIGIASGGFVDGALVLLLTLAVNQGEGLLSPFVVGHNVNLHPLVVLLSAIAGIAIAGVLGGVLAVPTVAIAWCVYRELVESGFFDDAAESA